ncbi:MAG TPA: hypothetical protein VG637_07305 [Actinomycetes bacterium]|jgi:hypothetical protein|nr:hypothetical protein [Actinomycetes bacterium]
MQRISTTVIGLVGERARLCAEGLERASNIRVELPDPDAPPLERAAAAWQAATSAHLPYLVHDADPLALVAAAWVRRYDEQGPAGELEVAVRETLARWRSRTIDLPDYYILLDPGSWDATRRHWYLGVLHRAAPARVVPADAAADQVQASIAKLSSGRWWPELDRLLADVDRVVPDRV